MMSMVTVLMACMAATALAQGYYQRPNPYQNLIVSAQAQDQAGNFGYATADGQSRTQTVAADGSVRGSYSYTDANGKPVTVNYIADKHGYRAAGDNIPAHAQHIPPPEVPAAPAAPSYLTNPYAHAPAPVATPQHYIPPPVLRPITHYNPVAEQQLANTILQHYHSDQVAQNQQLQQLEAIKRGHFYG